VLLLQALEIDIVLLGPLLELGNGELLEVRLLLALFDALRLVLALALHTRLAGRLRGEHQLELAELELDLLNLLGNGSGGSHSVLGIRFV